jgi:hypothetical protein
MGWRETVEPRQTFLGEQVAGQLRRHDDVLAVFELLASAKAQGARPNEDDEQWLVREFFQRDLPDQRCYLPLSIKGAIGKFASLTALLKHLADLEVIHLNAGKGVLLQSPTGTGKTLASLKAFRDCLSVDIASGEKPPLAGYLPVWLPVEAEYPEEGTDEEEKAAKRLFFQLLLCAAGLTIGPAALAHVPGWVKYGPPLLIFVDLN